MTTTYLDTVRASTIKPGANSIGVTFADEEIDFFINDIQENGILTPVRVIENAGVITLQDGHKRMYAAQVLGIDMIPVEVAVL